MAVLAAALMLLLAVLAPGGASAFESHNHFDIMVSDPPTPSQDCPEFPPGHPNTCPGPWNAGNYRYLTTLTGGGIYSSPGTGWTGGDRVGYGCAYGFLMVDGVPAARFTFENLGTPPGQAYGTAKINDKYMNEGQRYYDGTAAVPPDLGHQLGDCPAPLESYSDHTGAFGPTPDIFFTTPTGGPVDERNYALDPGGWPPLPPNCALGSTGCAPFHFDFVPGVQTPTHIAFITYQMKTFADQTVHDSSVMAIYYDLLRPDLLNMTDNFGTTPPPPTYTLPAGGPTRVDCLAGGTSKVPIVNQQTPTFLVTCPGAGSNSGNASIKLADGQWQLVCPAGVLPTFHSTSPLKVDCP